MKSLRASFFDFCFCFLILFIPNALCDGPLLGPGAITAEFVNATPQPAVQEDRITCTFRIINNSPQAFPDGAVVEYTYHHTSPNGSIFGNFRPTGRVQASNLAPRQSVEARVDQSFGISGDFSFEIESVILKDRSGSPLSEQIMRPLSNCTFHVGEGPKDFVITTVRMIPSDAQAASNPSFEVTVTNTERTIGRDVPVRMELFRDNQKVSDWPDGRVPFLSGAPAQLGNIFRNIQPGSYVFRVTIDPDNRITETNKQNNTQELPFRIAGAEPAVKKTLATKKSGLFRRL